MIYKAVVGEPPTGNCAKCGDRALVRVRLYCSRTCKRRAQRMRREGQTLTAPAGYCRACGVVELPTPTPARYCSHHYRLARWEVPWVKFTNKSRVIVDDWRPWLAQRLKLEADDPRLEEIALRFAENGKLNVYVGVEGTVTALAEPRKKKAVARTT